MVCTSRPPARGFPPQPRRSSCPSSCPLASGQEPRPLPRGGCRRACQRSGRGALRLSRSLPVRRSGTCSGRNPRDAMRDGVRDVPRVERPALHLVVPGARTAAQRPPGAVGLDSRKESPHTRRSSRLSSLSCRLSGLPGIFKLMSVSVHLPEKLAARLAAEAARQGRDVDEVAAELLGDRLPAAEGELDVLEAFIGSGDSGDPSWAGRDTAELRAEAAARRHAG